MFPKHLKPEQKEPVEELLDLIDTSYNLHIKCKDKNIRSFQILHGLSEKDPEFHQCLNAFIHLYSGLSFLKKDRELKEKSKNIWEEQVRNLQTELKNATSKLISCGRAKMPEMEKILKDL
jgi:hypothetical protein